MTNDDRLRLEFRDEEGQFERLSGSTAMPWSAASCEPDRQPCRSAGERSTPDVARPLSERACQRVGPSPISSTLGLVA
jgi:hypothetical protein